MINTIDQPTRVALSLRLCAILTIKDAQFGHLKKGISQPSKSLTGARKPLILQLIRRKPPQRLNMPIKNLQVNTFSYAG